MQGMEPYGTLGHVYFTRVCLGGRCQLQAESLTRNLVIPATAFANHPFDAIELLRGSQGHPGGLRLLRDDFLFGFCPTLTGE
jgi:hypothetical protein